MGDAPAGGPQPDPELYTPRAQMRRRLSRALPAVVCALAWTAMSSAAILVNKHIMVDLHFPYPVTVAWLGLLTTTLASTAVVKATIPPTQRVRLSVRAFMTRAMPTGLMMAVTFQCGNTAYLYLTVAFIQMLKAFCPVITMLLLFVARLEKPTSSLIATVLVISSGVAMASYGEMNMSVVGVTVMMTSVVSESARLVLTQHLVSASHQLQPFEGLMYIGAACTFWLTLQAAVWEAGRILSTGALAQMYNHPSYFLVAALAGFGVNTTAILVIKLTNSLTLRVLGTVKDAAIVTFGVVFMREQVSSLQLYGYGCSLAGFTAYNYLNWKKTAHTHARSPLAQPLLPTHIVSGKSA